ncbi:MAG: hypothetical protein GVY20_06815 [Bacteroidetes bacterium]|jgi:hypothetical protein|nr:hypothetical protein [Bacteroidota bacterium]
MMKKNLSILLLLTLFTGIQISSAQQHPDLKYRTFRVTLFPGLSTNGVEAPNYSAKYSLNILGGYHGALDGYEIGIVNINKYYAEGLQLGVVNGTGGHMMGLGLASLVNFAGDEMQGLHFAGIGNLSSEFMQGLQFAGIMNMGGGGMQGLQFAGIGNLAGDDIQGLQFAGIFNAGSGDSQGIKMSGIGNFNGGFSQGIHMGGILNVAYEMQGISMAGILNVANEMVGVQLAGIANIADEAQGVQVGLVNIADEFEGVPVGLISLYGNGRKNLDFWVSDGGYTNVGLKLGTMDIYNMISLGYNSALNSEELWSFGWAIGAHTPLEEAWNNDRFDGYFRMKDISIQSIQEEDDDVWETNLYSFRYLLGKEISNGFGIYAGPTLNLLVQDEEDQRDYSWYSIFDGNRWDKNFDFWVGFTAGVQLF